MAHDHNHDKINYNLAFGVGILLNTGFVIAEVIFGILSDSMALLADAGHNLSDILGLILAWGASLLSTRSPSFRRTYGWKSSTIIAALLNAIILLVAVGGISWESIRRFGHPEPVAGATIIYVAAIGTLINAATALMFMAGRAKDLNIRGAFLHMAADAGVSLGVVLAGFGIVLTGWTWIDPIVSLGIAAIILIGTWGLFKDSFNLAIQAVPEEIDTKDVADYLSSIEGVKTIHDLHIWAMSTTEVALTAHLVKPGLENEDALLARIQTELHDRFGIEHTTLQIERSAALLECGDACQIDLSDKNPA